MTETATTAHDKNPVGPAPTIERVVFDEDLLDHPFIPSRRLDHIQAFLADFAQAQAAYTPVVREKEVSIKPRGDGAAYKFKYAELANVLEATKALHAHGISVSQPVHEDRAGVTWLYTNVMHRSGAGQSTRLKLAGGSDIKAFGGEITYLRRYCYAPAIGVASEDDADNNGDGGGGNEGDYRRDRDDPPQEATPRPSAVARKSASAPSAAAEAKAPLDPLVTTGQLKNLKLKLASLKLDPQTETMMLERLGVPVLDEKLTLEQWKKVNAELTNS